jgi:hypothetical protein
MLFFYLPSWSSHERCSCSARKRQISKNAAKVKQIVNTIQIYLQKRANLFSNLLKMKAKTFLMEGIKIWQKSCFGFFFSGDRPQMTQIFDADFRDKRGHR